MDEKFIRARDRGYAIYSSGEMSPKLNFDQGAEWAYHYFKAKEINGSLRTYDGQLTELNAKIDKLKSKLYLNNALLESLIETKPVLETSGIIKTFITVVESNIKLLKELEND